MEIKEIKEKEKWENFLLKIEEKTFLQSFNWGEFQKMLGNKIWRLAIFEKSELVALAQVVKIKARRGKFLFVPHGPLVLSLKNEDKSKFKKKEILESLLKELKAIAGREKVSFIRIAPIWQRSDELKKIFKDLGLIEAPLHIHPEVTWQLDISKEEETLLAEMRKTTRYLIKQGLRNTELKIEKSKEAKNIEIFNALYQETVNRHNFTPFSLDYLKKEFSAFSADNQILIFLAKYRGEYLASAFIIFWQGIAFYHQGASVQKYPKVSASYLLQWEAIKEAKKRDCKIYNFWGIAPEKAGKKHPWWGLTLFKKGFGGEKKEYLKTQDLPLSISYWLTFFFEKLRKIKRNL